MKHKVRILIGFLVVTFLFSSCLTREQNVPRNAKKRYKNFQPADCGCKK